MNNLILSSRSLLSLVVVAGIASVGAQATPSENSPLQPPITGYHTPLPRLASDHVEDADKSFLEKAALSGKKEVAVSQAVLPHLQTAAARKFAEMMVNDHTKANAELEALAAKKAVALEAVDPKLAAKWGEKRKDADEAYMKEMISDHEDAVKLFEKATKSEDAEIAAFAKKTLPTLRAHLELAKGNKSEAHGH